MSNFQITSKAGVDQGLWEGETAEEALISLFREVGYGEDVVWIEGHIVHASEDYRFILGGVSDWIIEKID